MIGKPLSDVAAWEQLAGLRQYKRAWVIVSRGYRWIAEDDERRLLHALDQMGQRVSVTRSTRAAAYLYRFQ